MNKEFNKPESSLHMQFTCNSHAICHLKGLLIELKHQMTPKELDELIAAYKGLNDTETLKRRQVLNKLSLAETDEGDFESPNIQRIMERLEIYLSFVIDAVVPFRIADDGRVVVCSEAIVDGGLAVLLGMVENLQMLICKVEISSIPSEHLPRYARLLEKLRAHVEFLLSLHTDKTVRYQNNRSHSSLPDKNVPARMLGAYILIESVFMAGFCSLLKRRGESQALIDQSTALIVEATAKLDYSECARMICYGRIPNVAMYVFTAKAQVSLENIVQGGLEEVRPLLNIATEVSGRTGFYQDEMRVYEGYEEKMILAFWVTVTLLSCAVILYLLIQNPNTKIRTYRY